MTETEMLSEQEVAEIEARADAASPKPWSMTWNTSFGPAIWSHGDILVRCEARLKHSVVSEADPTPQWRKDMDFIRAAREDIPALCQTVRALREKHSQLAEVSGERAKLLDRIRAWSKCEDGYPLDEHINNIATQNTALREQLTQAQKRIALWFGPNTCSVCGGAPLVSGRPCVCGGKGTMQAEFEGLRQELFDMESRLAQVEKAVAKTRTCERCALLVAEALQEKP